MSLISLSEQLCNLAGQSLDGCSLHQPAQRQLDTVSFPQAKDRLGRKQRVGSKVEEILPAADRGGTGSYFFLGREMSWMEVLSNTHFALSSSDADWSGA